MEVWLVPIAGTRVLVPFSVVGPDAARAWRPARRPNFVSAPLPCQGEREDAMKRP